MKRDVGFRQGDLFGASDRSDQRHVFPGIDQRLGMEFDGGGIDERHTPASGEDRPQDRKKRWGFWRGVRFLLSGPVSTIGVDRITESASVIAALARQVRTGPRADRRVHVYDDRTLDLDAMADDAGVSVAQVRRLLRNRRCQTKRAVLCYLLSAVAFFGLWVWRASVTAAYTRLSYVAVLLLICGLFCLSAFYNALVNWQCRTERLGTWREFLSTNESWWPS